MVFGNDTSEGGSSFGDAEKKYCCRGNMQLTAFIVFGDVADNPTMIGFTSTVQVDTGSTCLDVKCKGKDWANPFEYTTCERECNNPDINTQFNSGNGTAESPLRLEKIVHIKLGCCASPGCGSSQRSNVRDFNRVVPGVMPPDAQMMQDAMDQIISEYGVGGASFQGFPDCCTETAPPRRPVRGWSLR